MIPIEGKPSAGYIVTVQPMRNVTHKLNLKAFCVKSPPLHDGSAARLPSIRAAVRFGYLNLRCP